MTESQGISGGIPAEPKKKPYHLKAYQQLKKKRRRGIMASALAAYRSLTHPSEPPLFYPEACELRVFLDRPFLELWIVTFPRHLDGVISRLKALGFHPLRRYHSRAVLVEPQDLLRAAHSLGMVRDSLIDYCLLLHRSPRSRFLRQRAEECLRDYYPEDYEEK